MWFIMLTRVILEHFTWFIFIYMPPQIVLKGIACVTHCFPINTGLLSCACLLNSFHIWFTFLREPQLLHFCKSVVLS